MSLFPCYIKVTWQNYSGSRWSLYHPSPSPAAPLPTPPPIIDTSSVYFTSESKWMRGTKTTIPLTVVCLHTWGILSTSWSTRGIMLFSHLMPKYCCLGTTHAAHLLTCSFLWESQTSYTRSPSPILALLFFTTNEARKITDSKSCHAKNLIYPIGRGGQVG